MRTVVIGLGNPFLSDDSVGLKVVHAVSNRLNSSMDAETALLHTGGISLMEAMAGFERAVVVDAAVTGQAEPGAIHRLRCSDLLATKNTHSSHDSSLAVALELGKMAGLQLPAQVLVWAIEAGDVITFGDRLTPAVAEAVPLVVNEIVDGVLKGEHV